MIARNMEKLTQGCSLRLYLTESDVSARVFDGRGKVMVTVYFDTLFEENKPGDPADNAAG